MTSSRKKIVKFVFNCERADLSISTYTQGLISAIFWLQKTMLETSKPIFVGSKCRPLGRSYMSQILLHFGYQLCPKMQHWFSLLQVSRQELNDHLCGFHRGDFILLGCYPCYLQISIYPLVSRIVFLTPQILRPSNTFLCSTYHSCNYQYDNSVNVGLLNQIRKTTKTTVLIYSSLCLLHGAKCMATAGTH